MLSTSTEQAVIDLRRGRRFNTTKPLPAQLLGNEVEVMNLSAEGLQIRHAAFVKIGTRGTLRVENADMHERVSLQIRVLWSRLSTVADANGKYLYLSGLAIEDASLTAGAIGRLIRSFAQPDTGSMDRKRKALEERTQRRSTIVVTPTGPELRISRDQLLLIKEAREKLEANPAQAKEWYSRAKILAKQGDEERPLPYRQDVLAIWGYLGGHVELDQVALVYELTNESRA